MGKYVQLVNIALYIIYYKNGFHFPIYFKKYHHICIWSIDKINNLVETNFKRNEVRQNKYNPEFEVFSQLSNQISFFSYESSLKVDAFFN